MQHQTLSITDVDTDALLATGDDGTIYTIEPAVAHCVASNHTHEVLLSDNRIVFVNGCNITNRAS